MPKSFFVLGYDTFIRLLDIKYYGNSLDNMKEILKVFEECGSKFFVGGRMNSLTKNFDYLDEQSLEIVPAEFKDMFAAIKDFRVDISSTELRAKGITVWMMKIVNY